MLPHPLYPPLQTRHQRKGIDILFGEGEYVFREGLAPLSAGYSPLGIILPYSLLTKEGDRLD